MKLNKDFLIHNAGSDSILVSTGKAGFSGVVRGNKTFGAVLEIMKSKSNGFTEAEIIAAMKEKFDAAEGAIERDVRKAIEELRRIGAVVD